MGGSNLSVRITADIVDLQTKFAVAKAEVSGLTSEMNKLARASATGVIDSAGQAKLQQVAGDLLKAKSNASSLAGAMQAAGVGTSMFGQSAAAAGEHSATAVRYIRELFDEISSGRTRYLPSTLAALGQFALHMNLAMLASVGAVGAVIGALGYLGVKAIEASHQLDEIKLGADFAGNLDVTRGEIQRFTEALSSAANISGGDARKIATALAEIPGMTMEELEALEPLISRYMQATDQNAEKASESLKKLFEPTESATAAAEVLHVSQSLIDMARAADQTGNANEVAAAKVKLLEGVLTPMTGDLAKTVSGYKESAIAALRWFSAISQGLTPQQASAEITKENTELIRQQTESVRARALALSVTPPTTQQTLQLGMSVAEGENPVSQQMEEAKQKIAEMTAALGVAKAAGDALDVKTLNAGLDKAQDEVTKLAHEEVQAQQQWVDSVIATQEQARTEASQVAQSGFEQSTEYLNQELQAEKQAASQKQQIARINADAEIQISREKLEAVRSALAEEVEASKGAAAQKYAALKQLTTQEAALDIQQLENERATLAQEPVEAARVDAQILELKAKLVSDLAKLNQQAAQASRQAAQQDADEWKKAVDEIESAESRMVSDLVSRRKSLSETLLQVSSQLVTQEIQNDLRAITTRILLHTQATAAEKALDQGGALYYEAMQLLKTGTTHSQQAAQTAAVQTGATAQTAATTTAAAAQKAVAAAVGTSTVTADAAKAYAGTYASVAQIPYVGWILAPAAAAAAFADVAAFTGMASLDVGAYNVPQDMVAQIHKGEMVVPTTYAEGMRQNGGNGSGSSAAGGGDVHHHYNFNISAWDGESVRRWAERPESRATIVKMAQAHYNRGWRPSAIK